MVKTEELGLPARFVVRCGVSLRASMATIFSFLSSERQVNMKWLYFFLMKLFKSKPYSKCYMWAYRKCINAYVDKDPDYGYFRFANDYFKTLADYTDPGLR